MPGNPNAILGKVTIQLNGQYMPSQPNASCEPGGVARVTKVGDQVHGPVEVAKQSRFSITFPAKNGISVTSLNNFRGPITFQGDNGVTLVAPDAWCMGDARLVGTAGDITATFEGDPCQESGNSTGNAALS
jgi:hypothetical protein